MPGLLYNRLFEVAASQYGYVTAADARALGAPVGRLSTMTARGTLVHVSSGVYRFPAFPVTGWISSWRRRCGRTTAAC
jgi:hypothetical protein